MTEINKDNLEKALSSKEKPKSPQMSKEMEVGFHQGTLNTLVAERNELVKLIQNIEMIMQSHLKRLEELGIKIQQKKK